MLLNNIAWMLRRFRYSLSLVMAGIVSNRFSSAISPSSRWIWPREQSNKRSTPSDPETLTFNELVAMLARTVAVSWIIHVGQSFSADSGGGL